MPEPFSNTGLRQLAESFTNQEGVGVAGNILLRLARYLQGDPAQWVTVTSANNTTPVGLPDNQVAMSAVLHVTGSPITYREDGTPPINGTDPVLPVGTIITIMGQPSMRSFRFVSNQISAAVLIGCYYD